MVLNQVMTKERTIKRVVHRSYSDDSSSSKTTITVAAILKSRSESFDGAFGNSTSLDVTAMTAAAINDVVRRMAPSQKRKVQFSETIRIRTLDGPSADVTPAELYWTANDFNTIRISAKLDTRNLKTHAKEGIQLINDAFASAFTVAQTHSLSGKCDSEGQLMSCLVEPDQTFVDGLSANWSSNPLCGRGLERYVSNQHRQDRAEYGRGVRTLLLKESKQLQLAPDALAQLYHDASLPGAIFARTMAEADARAVRAMVSDESDVESTAEGTKSSAQPSDEVEPPRRSRPMLQRQKSFEPPPPPRMMNKLGRDNSRRNVLAAGLMRREGSERKIILTS